MNYQTEEVLPMLGGANSNTNKNKKSSSPKQQFFGLAALMVLCVAVTSFMAGHAYSSAATASVLQSQAGWSSSAMACNYFKTKVTETCGSEAGACAAKVMDWNEGDYASCKPADASAACSRYLDYPPSMC